MNIGAFDQKLVERIMAFGQNDQPPETPTNQTQEESKPPEPEDDHHDSHSHMSHDEADRSNQGLINENGNLQVPSPSKCCGHESQSLMTNVISLKISPRGKEGRIQGRKKAKE